MTCPHAAFTCDGATKDGRDRHGETGWAWGSAVDERGNRTERRRARTGGRAAEWTWDGTAVERQQHEGGGGSVKEDRRPDA